MKPDFKTYKQMLKVMLQNLQTLRREHSVVRRAIARKLFINYALFGLWKSHISVRFMKPLLGRTKFNDLCAASYIARINNIEFNSVLNNSFTFEFIFKI